MDQSLPDGLGFAIPISEMRPHCEFRLDPSELGIFVDRAGKRAMVSGGTAGISPSSFAAIPWLPMLRSMIWNAFGRYRRAPGAETPVVYPRRPRQSLQRPVVERARKGRDRIESWSRCAKRD